MAQIDVAQLMCDPDFVDPLQIVHRKTVVNEMGENTLTCKMVNSVGSIQPADGKTLSRFPDAYRSTSVYSFWIKGVIIADGRSQYPDLLVYKNEQFEVTHVADWSNFGAGYSEGICVRKKISL